MLVSCMICCCSKGRCSSNSNKEKQHSTEESVDESVLLRNDVESNRIRSSYQSTDKDYREPYKRSLALLVDTEDAPSVIWSSLGNEDRTTLVNAMLNKCVPITFSDFLKYFHDYASFSWNRHNYFCRHPHCVEENHVEFTNCCSSEPICYYGMVDWNYCRIKAYGLYFSIIYEKKFYTYHSRQLKIMIQ